MPRGKQKKTMSGDPAQKVSSVPGQRYGEGVQQQALQQAMPAPDAVKASAPSVPQGQPVMPSTPPDPMQIQQFLASQNPAMLNGTQRLDEPVTAGLSTGPGPGPSALQNTTPIARYLSNLSAETGNPKWQRLAERAGL